MTLADIERLAQAGPTSGLIPADFMHAQVRLSALAEQYQHQVIERAMLWGKSPPTTRRASPATKSFGCGMELSMPTGDR